MTLDFIQVLTAVFACWRLTEIITIDRISEAFRKRYPHYLWGCPRCVSVWAGGICTLFLFAYIPTPWISIPFWPLNWALTLSWLFLVKGEWLSLAYRMRVQEEARRLMRRQSPLAGGSGELWQGILADTRAIDWSDPGVHIAGQSAGIPTRTYVCASMTTANTLSQINLAISTCSTDSGTPATGGVVTLAAGTYNFAGELLLKSNVTLRGVGADTTKLAFTSGGSACSSSFPEDVGFCGSFNWNGGTQNAGTWSGPFTKGSTTATITGIGTGTGFGGSGTLSVGQLLILDQADDGSDPALTAPYVQGTNPALFSDPSGSPGRSVGAVNYTQQEYKRVTNIAGSTITFTPPLYMPNWRASQTPGVWWAQTLLQNAGLENVTLEHSSTTAGTGVHFNNAYNCWMSGVRSVHTVGTGGANYRNHVWLVYSARVTIRDNYFYGTRNAQSLSYAIEPWQSGDLLVENNIFQHVASPLLVGNTHGSVFAYNYSIDHYNTIGGRTDFGFPGPSSMHDSGTAMNLFEGNQGTGLVEDNVHGTHNLNTYFRAQYIGQDVVGPAKTSDTAPVEFARFSRFDNIIGCVLGKAGYHTTYATVAGGSITNCNRSIYNIGFADSDCGGTTDALVSSTLMRWGNYDTIRNAVSWCGGATGLNGGPNTGWVAVCGSTSEMPTGIGTFANSIPTVEVLPNSFYLAAQPTTWWATPWGTPHWPSVGPEVTGGNVTSGSGVASTLGGHAHKIPARLCYENSAADLSYSADVSSLRPLLFNASSCYQASSAAPAAPTGLVIT